MRNMRVSAVVAVVLGGMLAGATAQAQAPRLRVKYVFDRSGADHWPVLFSVNDAGQAAGMVLSFSSGQRTPATFGSDGAHPLMLAPDGIHAQANGINDLGQAVGQSYNENFTGPFHAVTWKNGQIQILPVPEGFPYSAARAINGWGDIIGVLSPDANSNNPMSRGAFWHDGQVELIGPDHTKVTSINGRRQIVGCTGDDTLAQARPFLWEMGQYKPLPNLSGQQTGCAYSINEAGVIVGRSAGKPAIWQSGKVMSLAPAYTRGTAEVINNRGQTLGEVWGQISGRPFYRGLSGGIYDLRSMIDLPAGAVHPRLDRFLSMNDNGEILAEGNDQEGRHIYVLLEPYKPSGGTDNQAPSITFTSPTTGAYVSGLVTLKADVSDNVGVASVTFYAEGGRVAARTLTAPPWEVDLETFKYDTGSLLLWAEARDAAGNVSITHMRSIFIDNRCQQVAAGQTYNGWLGTQTGTFTVRWSAQAFSDESLDAGFALAKGKPGFFSGTNAIVLFAPDREIKVRNGASYPPSGVRYLLERYHHFRMDVDVPANRYSVWLKMPNEPEKQLASGYAFRNATTVLDGWMIRVDAASSGNTFKVCNVAAKATTP